MADNLVGLYAQQYATNIQLLLQQKGSKLRPWVHSLSHVGKQASPVDQIGAINANVVTSRFAPMPRTDAPTTRRWVYPVDYDLSQLIDTLDRLRMIVDPQSSYVQNAMWSMGRAMDDEIINAFFGPSQVGETGSITETFPSANIIANNYGASAATGLTVAKLRYAKQQLMARFVDIESDPLICVVTAKQHDNLLAEAQVISSDFNPEVPVLVEGRVTRFLGIEIVHCERLQFDTFGNQLVPVYAKSGMHLGIWEDIKTDVHQRRDLQNIPWQIYNQGTFGGTRLEANKIVQVLCA